MCEDTRGNAFKLACKKRVRFLSGQLSVCLSVSIYLSAYLSLSKCLPEYLSLCLFVCLFSNLKWKKYDGICVMLLNSLNEQGKKKICI